MNLEEKIKKYKELGEKIEELEVLKKELGTSILFEMPEKTVKTTDYLVRCCQRLAIKTSLEEARLFNATKMKETVDKDKIKQLFELGQAVPGISEIHYIQVSNLKTSS